MATNITTTISSGQLRGTSVDGADRYLGVPYAAAPVGDLRLRLPAPHPGWEGLRDATTMGATSPQAPYAGPFETMLPLVMIAGDEYLNVNIWAPTGAKDAPVMVWVHGGANVHGSNSLGGYDGSAFARDGIVFVGINYRLGAEGFSVLDDVPLNLGLSDVAAALRWVRAEIAAFGGDPSTVTAFGESAGSILLGNLLALPEAKTLFDRVALESGAPTAVPRGTARKITQLVAKRLGIPTTRAGFVSKTPAEIIAAELAVTAGSTPITGGASYATAIGGPTAPVEPGRAILVGAGRDIDLLMGSNAEEYRLWFVPLGLMDKISPVLFTAIRLRFRISGRILRAYRESIRTGKRPDTSRGALFGELATDILVRLPINRIADSRLGASGSTHVYEFAWNSPEKDLGAAHAMEIGFVFDTLRSPDWPGITGPNPPQQLTIAMHSAWVAFAKTGDPGWEAWNAKRPVQEFDDPASGVVYAPRESTRSVWKK
ncbi:MAG: carboxylesterase [Microbacteriaceae bacterium]|nr:carboxylesterase [Microbacteriaceae bacterium]